VAKLLGFLKVALQKKDAWLSQATVIRTIQNFLERKSLATQPRSGRPKLLKFEHKQILKSKTTRNQLNNSKNCFMKKPDLMFL